LARTILDINGFWNKNVMLNGEEIAEYQANKLKIKGKTFEIKLNGIVLAKEAKMTDEKGSFVCSVSVETSKNGYWPFKKEYFVVNINGRQLISDAFIVPPKEEIILREAKKGEGELLLKLFSYPLVGEIRFDDKFITKNEVLEIAFTLYVLTTERYVN